MNVSLGPEATQSVVGRFNHGLTWTAAAAALLMFAPLFIPLFCGRFFALDDLTSFHLPLRYLYQHALRAGDTVLWTSQLFSGFYIHAEGQIGAFHPLHLLLYAALPLTIAFDFELIASYVFGFAGMWRFLRYLGFATASSLVGALAFTFSGFALLHLPHMNAIAVIAHVPWLLQSIDLALSEAAQTRRTGLIAISLLIASQALLGYPQYLWMSALTCVVYVTIRAGTRIAPLIFAGAASVAGLMLAGIQLVPSLDLLENSVRTTVDADFAVSYSMHPLNILQLFSPYLLLNRVYAPPHERIIHEFGIYSGALATVAFVWTFIRRREVPYPGLAVFAVATSLAGLVLALGRYGVMYDWFTMVPLVGLFRAPARHIVLVHLGFSLLIAILFEDLRRLCVQGRRASAPRHLTWLWVPVLISMSTAAVAWWRPQLWTAFPDQPLYGGGMLFGGVFLGLVTLLVADAARGSRSALLALPLVLAIDLGLWGYSYVFAGGMHTIAELAALAEPPPTGPGSTVHHPGRVGHLNALLLHDLRVLRPYVGLVPARSLTLSTEDELRVSGVEWVATEAGWARVADPMPRVRFVADWQLSGSPAALTGIDVRRTALVTEQLRAEPVTGASATILVDKPGRMLVDVSTRAPALLVTTEAYDRGWHAAGPSGAILHTTRVYGDYLGVVAEPGQYRIALSFDPDSMKTGVYTSISGLVLMTLIAALGSRSGRRRDADSASSR